MRLPPSHALRESRSRTLRSSSQIGLILALAIATAGCGGPTTPAATPAGQAPAAEDKPTQAPAAPAADVAATVQAAVAATVAAAPKPAAAAPTALPAAPTVAPAPPPTAVAPPAAAAPPTVAPAPAAPAAPAAQPGAKPAPFTPDAFLAAAKAAGIPIVGEVVYTAETDPDKLLGRPVQYTGKASWRDGRIPGSGEPSTATGGTIEIFANDSHRQWREYYIGELAKQGVTPEYVYSRGRFLLRVSKSLNAAQAGEYERLLAGLSG
jgi:hypothetical protein